MITQTEPMSVRSRVYQLLNSNDKNDHWARIVTISLIALIALNVIAVILETVELYHGRYSYWFQLFDVFSVTIFTIEYVLRVWSSVEDPDYQKVSHPRLRYIVSPMALIDLLAIAPFYLSLFFVLDLRFLRALRLLRVFKLTRYSNSMTMVLDVFQEEAGTLFAGFFLLLMLLVMASSGAYLVEHKAQPEAFGSIPQAMWWALVTLTTVGYGDVTPITVAGKIFGGIITILGVGMAALPAGILASGVADYAHQRRDGMRKKYHDALADGIVDADEKKELEVLRKNLGISQKMANQIRAEVLHDKEKKERELEKGKKGEKDCTGCVCPDCGRECVSK